MTARDDILTNWRTQLTAMDEADTSALAACFTPDATLVHMTGYRQPLDEWMDGIRARQFVYHRVVEKSVEVTIQDDDNAKVSGHILTGVTDDGSGQTWPLDVAQDFVRIGDAWLCSSSRVTMW
ncbi:nuclear transport factor 2 family protein [Mariniluteicoccus flavus]